MKRRLFTSLSALSLLLCLAAALLWVRSIWVVDTLTHNSSDSRSSVALGSMRGRVALAVAHYELPQKLSGGWDTYETKQSIAPGWGFLGFDVRHLSNGADGAIILFVPHWFLIAVFAILPVLWVRRWRRLRRASRKGLCLTCGYDLRASKDRCPECGAPITPAADPRLP